MLSRYRKDRKEGHKPQDSKQFHNRHNVLLLICFAFIFILSGCDIFGPSNNKQGQGEITMTITGTVVYLEIIAIGDVAVDWGGEGKEEIHQDDYSIRYRYVYQWEKASEYVITIYGNVTHLRVAEIGLTSLDLTKNPQLEELYISYSNMLTSLDLTRNKKLKRLFINRNPITSLDLKNNVKLESIGIYGTQLHSLDLTSNNLLESVSLDSNQITSLNIGNKKMLRYLDVSKNQLSHLNIMSCATLYCLVLVNNQLTNLNLSGCTSLSYAFLSNNRFLHKELDDLFHTLHNNDTYGKHITVFYNPGDKESDKTIAESKGWQVGTEYPTNGNSE